MATYRYWRTTTTRYGNAGFSAHVLVAMELYDTPGGTDLTLAGTGTPSANGTYLTNVPAFAFDHNNATAWAYVDQSGPAYSTAWLQYDFGAETEVGQVVLRIESTNPPSTYQIAGSHDGVEWDDLSFVAAFNFAAAAVYTVPIGASIARPFRINGMARRDVPSPSVQPGRFSRWLSGGRNDGGAGSIAGHVEIAGTPDVPVRRQVRLHNRMSGSPVLSVWSDATTGAYRFNGLALDQTFYVVAFDDALNFNAVVKDNVTPQVMP